MTIYGFHKASHGLSNKQTMRRWTSWRALPREYAFVKKIRNTHSRSVASTTNAMEGIWCFSISMVLIRKTANVKNIMRAFDNPTVRRN
jgi:hypothetical protein